LKEAFKDNRWMKNRFYEDKKLIERLRNQLNLKINDNKEDLDQCEKAIEKIRKDYHEKIEELNNKLKHKDRLIRDLRETIKDPEYPKKQA
jgi:hypothetical protein